MNSSFQIWMELMGWTALHLIWQMVVIAVLVYLCVQLMPKRAYQTRLAIYGSGMVAVILASMMTFGWQWSQWMNAVTTEGAIAQNLTILQLTAAEESGGILDFLSQQSALFGMIWLVGLLIFTIYRAGGFLVLRRLKQKAEPVTRHWQDKVDALVATVNRTGSLPVRVSRDLGSPVLAGLFQPVILIPMGMWQVFDEEEIECIIFHEFVHWARYDQWIHMAVVGFESLFFFHPLAWWWGKEVRQLQELIVDREVVQLGAQPKKYAQSLFKAQQWSTHAHLPAPAFGRKKGQLLERIEHILNTRSTMRTKMIRTEQWSMVFLIGLLLLSGTWSAFAAGEEKTDKAIVEVCQNESQHSNCKDGTLSDGDFRLHRDVNDSLPEKDNTIKLKDLEISFDENGNPVEVMQTKKEVKLEVNKGKGQKENVQRIERLEKKTLDFEEKLQLTRNEDGTVDTLHQLIVRKPSEKGNVFIMGDRMQFQPNERIIVKGNPRVVFPETREFRFEVMDAPKLGSQERALERAIEVEIQREIGNDLEDYLEERIKRNGLSEEEFEIKVDGERLFQFIEKLGGETTYKIIEDFEEGELIEIKEIHGDVEWIEVRKKEARGVAPKIIIQRQVVGDGEEVIKGLPNGSDVIIRKKGLHPGTERLEGKQFIMGMEADSLPEWADREAFQVRFKEMEAKMQERMAREEERIAQMQERLRQKAQQMKLSAEQEQEIMEMTQKMERMLQEGWKERQEELRMMEKELREKTREMERKIIEGRRLQREEAVPPPPSPAPTPPAPELDDE